MCAERVDGCPYVVGIGASAGGLEALQSLLPNLRATGCAAYLIAQHMAHDGHSELLVRLLSRASPLETVLAQDGDALQPDRIFLIPSGRDGLIQNGRIRLLPPFADTLSTPSVNVLFSSIARACGSRAIGILLSGTGSDGVAGCRAIKAAGGLTIAQDPATATFDGMPMAAIEAATIVKILPEASIPDALLAVLPGVSPRPAAAVPSPQPPTEPTPQLRQLLTMLLAATGRDYTGYKEETLQRRLEKRFATLGIAGLEAYIAYVARTPGELSVLEHLFLVSLSSFYRDRAAFQVAEQALRRVVTAKRPGEAIRVWVPGCASGEEAYTLAIILSEIVGQADRQRDIAITGTDLNPDVLDMARAGLFRQAAFKEMEPHLRDRYFVSNGLQYQVNDAIRALCHFRRHDIVNDPPLSALDMVSCRNLLIYLKGPLQDQLITMFHHSLLPHGLLLIGPSESIGLKGNALFTPVDRYHNLYRRR